MIALRGEMELEFVKNAKKQDIYVLDFSKELVQIADWAF
jgi:hypothetical protein